jgi:hypothetical protein
LLKKRFSGARQAEVFAQGLAFVLATEEPAPLQFGDHPDLRGADHVEAA